MEEIVQQDTWIGPSGNYEVYLLLAKNQLQIILMSNLNDELYELKLTNATLPTKCKKYFENVAQFFKSFQSYLGKNVKENTINDTGNIRILHRHKSTEDVIELKPQKVVNVQKKYASLLSVIKMKKFEEKKKSLMETKYEEMRKKMNLIKKGKMSKFFFSVKQYKDFSLYFNSDEYKITVSSRNQNAKELYPYDSLPVTGCCYLTFKIIESNKYSIIVGIREKSNENEKKSYNYSDTAVCFFLETGQIKSANHTKEEMYTCWSMGAKKIKYQKNGIIKMIMDMDKQEVSWLYNEVEMAKTFITNHLKSKQIIPYICFRDNADSIILNYDNAQHISLLEGQKVKEEEEEEEEQEKLV